MQAVSVHCFIFVALSLLAGPAEAVASHDESATKQDGFSFPPEWLPHDAVWMGWSYDPTHHPVQIEMIAAMAPAVPVRLQATTDEVREHARASLEAVGVPMDRVEFVHIPAFNPWARDPGPLFLSNGRELAVAQFGWNWYGYPERLTRGWPDLGDVGKVVAEQFGYPRMKSDLVAEGGAIEVSTRVMLTYRDTTMQRNPDVPIERIEAEYLRMYGKEKLIWLSRAPISDRQTGEPKIENYVGWGANGHIDEFVRFVNDTTIVIASIGEHERDADPLTKADYEILKENLAELRAAVNVDGKPFEIITLPMPTLRHFVQTRPVTEADKQSELGRVVLEQFEVGDEVNFVPQVSYLNFFITNEMVLVPAYWKEGMPESERQKDEQVKATLQRLFPDRRMVQINPLAINWGGGGMHCMTQQQPAIDSARDR